MPKELWTKVCNTVQEAVAKTIPMNEKCNKARWMSEEALQIGVNRRKAKGKGVQEDLPN